MADKAKDVFPLPITISSGEQPDAKKFNALTSQVNNGLQKIEFMVGDLWGDNRPYTVDSTRQFGLTTAWGKKRVVQRSAYNAAEDVDGNIPNRDGQIANLARLIGPASALNPRILPNVQVNESIWTAASTSESLTADRHSYKLKYIPTDFSGGTNFPGTFSDVSVFATEKTTVAAVNVYGDWYVAQDGTIYVAGRIESATTVTYAYYTGDGDTYPDATLNIIPDPNQTALAFIAGDDSGLSESTPQKGCTVQWLTATSRLQITLPTLTHAQADERGKQSLLRAGHDPNTSVQSTLPEVLSGFSSGDTIPDGFVYLYDNKNRKIVPGANYYYNSQTSFFVDAVDWIADENNDSGTALSGGGSNTWRFSVITVGVNITQTIDFLRDKFFHHRHLGLDVDGTHKIPHSELDQLFDDADPVQQALSDYALQNAVVPSQGYFIRKFEQSSIVGNEHPQYLHRFGYAGGGTDGVYANRDIGSLNDANVMRGDLVLGTAGKSGTSSGKGYSWESGDALDSDHDSHSIWFGGVPSTEGGFAAGAVRMFHLAEIQDPGSIEIETDSIITIFQHPYGSAPTTIPAGTGDRGLSFVRSNVVIGLEGSATNTNRFMFGAAVSEFNVIATLNQRNSISSWADAYRSGIRLKSTYGSSLYLGIRALGVDPFTGTITNSQVEDTDGRTGVLILEASQSDSGMVAENTGINWPGDSQHGAAVIVSPGGGSSGDSVLQTTPNEGFCRWKTRAAGSYLGANLGGFVHLVASSDYRHMSATDLEMVASNEEYSESFQTATAQLSTKLIATPHGRMCLDTDRGIDFVVRTQDYLHEEDQASNVNSNIGGGNCANFQGIYQTSRRGNIAEIRFTSTPDYYNFNTANWTPGANIQLMFGYGQDYKRHNTLVTVVKSPSALTDPKFGDPDFRLGRAAHSFTETLGYPTWHYKGGRNYLLNGIEATDYGSNLLGGGLIEGFRGFRSDPNQPPLHTYVFPFEYRIVGQSAYGQDTAGTNNWYSMNTTIHPYNGSVVGHSIRFPTSTYDDEGYSNLGSSEGNGTGWPLDEDDQFISWDQVIKWHDNRLHTIIGADVDEGSPHSSIASAELLLANWIHLGSKTSTQYWFSSNTNNWIGEWLVGNGTYNQGGNALWVPPADGPVPYVGGSGTEYNGDPNRAHSMQLWRQQIHSTRYWTWRMGLDTLGLGSTGYNAAMSGNTLGQFDRIAYRHRPITLNLTFGSNPWNIYSRNTGVHIETPYAGITPANYTDAGFDGDLSGTFTMVILGRLVLHLIGDCPYLLHGHDEVV